jgi:hypothetical protein
VFTVSGTGNRLRDRREAVLIGANRVSDFIRASTMMNLNSMPLTARAAAVDAERRASLARLLNRRLDGVDLAAFAQLASCCRAEDRFAENAEKGNESLGTIPFVWFNVVGGACIFPLAPPPR